MRGSKLLIGSIQKYQDIEDDGLVDSGEGTYSFVVDFPEPIEIPNKWANTLFSGALSFGSSRERFHFPGRFSSTVKDVFIDRVGESFTRLKHARAEVSYQALNALIFCASEVEGDPSASNPFADYDDFWVVARTEEETQKIGIRIAEAILKQIKVSSFVAHINSLTLKELQDVTVNLKHGRVQYLDRRFSFTSRTPQDFDSLMGRYLFVPFSKPPTYCNEKEYRFLFEVTCRGRILEVKKEDLFLDLNLLTAP
ncbi:hypothetical protein JI664_17530 [Rhodobacter sp. NTK016B]|uniref:hypothetical protein n=1 Tax=Rhodobacter sp. NTK016B TaxID=2759676 RepID=UPI001A8F2A08|nr:hypothetical protein [Rhodobacter sp. NTK016B]MBN8293777.1 hypothetical protein [Rhodobacter sp. NTK016B]